MWETKNKSTTDHESILAVEALCRHLGANGRLRVEDFTNGTSLYRCHFTRRLTNGSGADMDSSSYNELMESSCQGAAELFDLRARLSPSSLDHCEADVPATHSAWSLHRNQERLIIYPYLPLHHGRYAVGC